MGKLKPINPTKAQIVANPQAAVHDYDNLDNKPQINGVTLSGNKTAAELGVAGWEIAAIDNCIENGVLYSTSINNQAAYVLANNVTTDITQYAFCRDGRVMWRTRQAETPWQPAGEWSEWEEIGGGSQIVSGVVNQNGTITFTDSDGNTFTTSGASVIGPQGAPGNDYVLTPQDKADIANIVLQELPTTQGVQYGNAGN